MTKRDYEAIASGLNRTRPERIGTDTRYGADRAFDVWQDSVYAVGRVLAGDNPRFDARVFYAACEHGLGSADFKAALKEMRSERRAA